MLNKIFKFLLSKEIEVAPGVFWLGGTLYENRNKPTTPRPLKWNKSDNKDLHEKFNKGNNAKMIEKQKGPDDY